MRCVHCAKATPFTSAGGKYNNHNGKKNYYSNKHKINNSSHDIVGGGPGSIPGQAMRDLWWTKWGWAGFL
jgi:hypothetical protein